MFFLEEAQALRRERQYGQLGDDQDSLARDGGLGGPTDMLSPRAHTCLLTETWPFGPDWAPAAW
jgi:hypothetical protein